MNSMSKKSRESLELLKTKITITPKDQLLKIIETSLKKNKQIFITTPNPEIIVMSQKSKRYRNVLNNSDIAVPDGIGVSWAIKLLYGKPVKRIRGRELFLDLLDIANKNSFKVYLLGAKQTVNKSAVQKISKIYPKIIVEGNSDIEVDLKSSFDISNNTNDYYDVLNSINSFKPHMLFVLLGAPKQELWVDKYKSKLDSKLTASLGGSLDYFVGEQRLPPMLLSRIGLEWIWRLIFQPTRLKRIFNAVIVFPVFVLNEKIRMVLKK